MTNKKPPDELVKELLRSFQDDAPVSDGTTTIATPLLIDDAMVKPFCEPEVLAQLLSVFVSLIGTVAASGYSGYAFAITSEILPEIGRKMVGMDKVPAGHVEFVKKLLREPLRQIAKEDALKPPSEQRVPVLLQQLIDEEISLCLAMYHLGKSGVPLKPDGVAGVMHRITKELLANGGVNVNKGRLPEVLPELIKAAVDTAIAEYEAQYGKG